MALDRAEIESLHAEAKRIRKRFRYVHEDLKRSPQNIDLMKQRNSLKKRYEELQARLNALRAAGVAVPEDRDDEVDAPSVDMSVFEPKPFEIPAAVQVKQRGGGAARAGGARLSANDIRTIVSVSLLIVVLPFFYLYFMKGMRFYEVPSKSMEATLAPGDRIVALKPSLYNRGDIVVLPDPANPGDFLVKRLVAFGGDTVEIARGGLLVNGHPITEPYVTQAANEKFGPVTVPQGEVFLLGDNRNNSEDSRGWQEGKRLAALVGRVVAIYSPSGRRGFLPDGSTAFGEVLAP